MLQTPVHGQAPSRRDTNDQLAEVPAFEQTDEGLRGVLQTVHDVLAKLDLACLQPGTHLRKELAIAIALVVKNDEALHPDALLE